MAFGRTKFLENSVSNSESFKNKTAMRDFRLLLQSR